MCRPCSRGLQRVSSSDREWDRTLHAQARRTELVTFCNDNNTTARPSLRAVVEALHDHRSQSRRSVSK